jgi:hypothetical protein
MRAHAHCGVEREASVLPGEHLADVVRLDQPAAGEPAQHPHAYLLGDGGDGLFGTSPASLTGSNTPSMTQQW